MGIKATPCPFFNTWSRDMAYILGFWFADGHIAKDSYNVSFISIDLEHLEKVAARIGVPNSIYFADGCHRLVFSRKEAWNRIQKLGGTPAKSLTVSFPTVPNKFLADFIRGYVDGDGSLGWTNLTKSTVPLIQVYGNEQFLLAMQTAIKQEIGINLSGVYKHQNKIPVLKTTGIQAKCLSSWLYQRKGMSLDRKQVIANSFTKWQPKPRGYKKSCLSEKTLTLFQDVLPA